MNDMFALNSTDVRNEWSFVMDKAIREKPQFIKRTRDYMVLTDIHFLEELLTAYTFTADCYIEDDGSFTLALNEIDLVENAQTKEEAREKLAVSILEYSEDFYKEFNYWSSSYNRRTHIPYVFKALILNDVEKIGELVICQDGRT